MTSSSASLCSLSKTPTAYVVPVSKWPGCGHKIPRCPMLIVVTILRRTKGAAKDHLNIASAFIVLTIYQRSRHVHLLMVMGCRVLMVMRRVDLQQVRSRLGEGGRRWFPRSSDAGLPLPLALPLTLPLPMPSTCTISPSIAAADLAVPGGVATPPPIIITRRSHLRPLHIQQRGSSLSCSSSTSADAPPTCSRSAVFEQIAFRCAPRSKRAQTSLTPTLYPQKTSLRCFYPAKEDEIKI
ncbi:hypothetical protein X777_10951 [Ooceraea biroi]|uniref:Uncharacterized protein n=1 Tax=Ooceraea biroi TaxID=2015173 RepID=A0A026W3F7_OOCBI|nr:hypothetical protein X777_10951 [Ooceraea biroi]